MQSLRLDGGRDKVQQAVSVRTREDPGRGAGGGIEENRALQSKWLKRSCAGDFARFDTVTRERHCPECFAGGDMKPFTESQKRSRSLQTPMCIEKGSPGRRVDVFDYNYFGAGGVADEKLIVARPERQTSDGVGVIDKNRGFIAGTKPPDASAFD
jgi:hypothetical protein